MRMNMSLLASTPLVSLLSTSFSRASLGGERRGEEKRTGYTPDTSHFSHEPLAGAMEILCEDSDSLNLSGRGWLHLI